MTITPPDGYVLKCRNMPAFSARLWGNNRQFGGCSVSKRGYQIVTPYRMYVSVTVRFNGTALLTSTLILGG